MQHEIAPLLQLDWDEIEHRKDVRQLDPDWDAYQTIEDSGCLRIFTARSDGVLVGYFVVLLMPSLHSKGLMQATADVIFLRKEYRKGFTGYRLFKFAEQCVKDDGAAVLHVTTTNMNLIDPLMEKLGYTAIETKFEKVL